VVVMGLGSACRATTVLGATNASVLAKDVFVHISAVERSGLGGFSDGQKLSYEIEAGRQSGKSSAVNLKPIRTAIWMVHDRRVIGFRPFQYGGSDRTHGHRSDLPRPTMLVDRRKHA
jgi:cold shock CspA family protein